MWAYLRRQRYRFDVALLQETRDPGPWAERYWRSIAWVPKYEESRRGRPLWGSAIVARDLELEGFTPRAESWLGELRGSAVIARTTASPAWLASVHATARPISGERLARIPLGHTPLAARTGVWETDVISYELRHLFADETFLWGGDLNSAAWMDDFPTFAGGNRRLREIWKEAGSLDLRTRFYAEEQPTYFAPRSRPYQLDHVFADAQTETRVMSWRVNSRVATGPNPYSDHALIIVELEP